MFAFASALLHSAIDLSRLASILCAAALLVTGASVSSAQADGPSAYFLGTEDRNGDGVSDLNDGLNLYAVIDAQAMQISTGEENVRNYLPRFEDGTAAYVAQQAGGGLTLTIVGAADARHSTALTGLNNAVVQRYDGQVWITAQDEDQRFIIAGYDSSLNETARITVNLADPSIAFDPTGQWASATNADARTLLIYRLPDLTPVTLPSPVSPLGPPAWAHGAARLAVPVAGADGNGIEVALIEPPAQVNRGATLDLAPDSIDSVQLQWSAGDTYLTYRTLPGVALSATLPLRLIDAEAQTVTRLDEADIQLRVVNGSDDDRYALISEATAAVAGQISVNYRILDVARGQFTPDNPVNTFVTPVAFAWQPNAHALGILGKSVVDGKPGIFRYDVESGAVSTLYNTDDADLLKGNLFWSGDGASLLFTARLTDPLSELMGTTNTLRRLDPATAEVMVISPDGVSVLPYGLRIR